MPPPGNFWSSEIESGPIWEVKIAIIVHLFFYDKELLYLARFGILRNYTSTLWVVHGSRGTGLAKLSADSRSPIHPPIRVRRFIRRFISRVRAIGLETGLGLGRVKVRIREG